MVCPSFVEDYVGFCRTADEPYVPSIDEMERFCFSGKCSQCAVYKNEEPKGGSLKTKQSHERFDAMIFAGRYKTGSKSPGRPVAAR